MQNEQSIHSCQAGTHRMGLIVPLLALPLVIGMVRSMACHRTGEQMHWHAEWKNGVPPHFAEMHRRAHAAEAGEVHEA